MKRAIGKHWRDFVAVLVLFVIACGVGAVILKNQRLTLPAWVPVLGSDFFEIEAELSNAQAVTPGQGQTAVIAGVDVGQIKKVRLENGKAIVTLSLEDKYEGRIRKDATALLRPKTGLKDMTVEINPGSDGSPALRENDRIPISQTLPDVNLDELLAALDADTRSYLQLLIEGGGTALDDDNGKNLGQVIRRFEPLARDVRAINGQLAKRQSNIRRVIHNFSLLVDEIGSKDDQLAEFVENSNAVFDVFADQEANIRATLRELPGALTDTDSALGKTEVLANALGPALEDLRPGARALGPTLVAVRNFSRTTTPIIRDEIRPFVRAARPVVRELRPALRDLAAASPDLVSAFLTINRLTDMLAFNPPGEESEGYLFWFAWANHLANTVFTTQDAHGPIRRGAFIAQCNTLDVLDNVAAGNPQLATLIALLNPVREGQGCPSSSGAP